MRHPFLANLPLASLLLAGLILPPLTPSAHADDWADAAGDDKAYATSKQACLKARKLELPVIAGAAPKDCDSSALLYGIGRSADAVAARACAAREMKDDPDNPAAGAGTLATIYANGSGVARNYDLAIAYACRINGAPAEDDGRINHLLKLKASGPDKQPFDICDDATSGAMEGFCAERDGDLANASRKAEVATLTAKLAGPARAAFDKLRSAQQAFVKSSADNEVDVSGTARGMLIVQNQQGHENAFAATLRAVLDGKLAKQRDAKEADKQLNAAYGKVMALKDTSALGTVDKKGIKETQRLWLRYRDAFLGFAAAAAPAIPADALAAELTDARSKDLSELLGT